MLLSVFKVKNAFSTLWQQEIRGFSAVSLSKKLNSEISIGDAQNRQKKKAVPSGELTDSRSKRGRRR